MKGIPPASRARSSRVMAVLVGKVQAREGSVVDRCLGWMAAGSRPSTGEARKGRRGAGRAWFWYAGLALVLFLAGLGPMAAIRPVAARESIPPGSEPAAGELQIQQLRVQVMPEFDDPRVLVVAQGRLLAPDSAFPLAVTFRLPQGAQINQMAAMDMMTAGTRSQPFDVQPDPDDPRWSLVTYTLDNAHFFYEYYYNPLPGEPNRRFTFTLNNVLPIADLLLEVQQPLAARGFGLDPTPVATRLDEAFGFTYHQFQARDLAAGEGLDVAISYTKTDPAPSLSAEQVMAGMNVSNGASEMPPPTVASNQVDGSVPVWMFVLLGGATLAGVVLVIWYRARMDSATLAPALEASRGQFCRRCGTLLKGAAEFCHSCGASARMVPE